MKNRFALYIVSLISILMLVGCGKNQFDLQIDGGDETLGAEVYVDGKLLCRMKPLGGYGSHCSTWLVHGTHLIEVKKKGYHNYKETISVNESEYYLFVELEEDTL